MQCISNSIFPGMMFFFLWSVVRTLKFNVVSITNSIFQLRCFFSLVSCKKLQGLDLKQCSQMMLPDFFQLIKIAGFHLTSLCVEDCSTVDDDVVHVCCMILYCDIRYTCIFYFSLKKGREGKGDI